MRKKKMTNKTEWFVGKETNGKTFYVCEHDTENNTTMWCTDRKNAISFKVERAIHKFVKRYLHSRKDIILINVESDE